MVDPLAEGRSEMTPYHYTSNNPINRIDPDGRWDWYQSKETGTVKWFDGTKEQDGFDHIGAAGQVISSKGGAVNLNADGTATNSQTGENAAFSVSGKTRIVAKEGETPLWMTIVDIISGGEISDMRTSLDALDKEGVQGYLNTQISSVVSLHNGTGFGPNIEPIRYQGPWTTRDLSRANDGKGPLDFMPRQNKAGNEMPLELHHGDQMPGSGVHEVGPGHPLFVPHPNKFNQGVTPLMRKQDAQLHWYLRGLEMGN